MADRAVAQSLLRETAHEDQRIVLRFAVGVLPGRDDLAALGADKGQEGACAVMNNLIQSKWLSRLKGERTSTATARVTPA
jgi:hypothetical protein